jgi:hypothetical protein
MTDKTRFTLAKTGVIASGITGAFLLTACGGTSHVSGNLDDTNYLPSRPAVTTLATHQVPVYSRQCTTKYRTVTTGSGSFKKTSTQSYQSCSNVRTGYRTETYTKVLRAAQDAVYCVELDNVGGHKHNDDQWYEVDYSTYHKWSHRPEGAKVNKMPYYRSVAHCWY